MYDTFKRIADECGITREEAKSLAFPYLYGMQQYTIDQIIEIIKTMKGIK